MKILYLRTLYLLNVKAGGSVGHTAGVINSLSKLVDLSVLSNDDLPGVKQPVQIFKPLLFPMLPKDFSEFLYNFKMINLCLSKKTDVIYQRYSGFSFCGAYLAKKNNIPFVLEFNSSDVWTIKYWRSDDGILKNIAKYFYNRFVKIPVVSLVEKYNIRNADVLIVVSDVLKNTLVENGVDPEKILVNPNGVNPDEYSPQIDGSETRAKYNLNGKSVIGFIGTFGQWHGAESIAKAYGDLLRAYPLLRGKTRLLMVGDGVRMNDVRKIINQYGMDEYVILTGLVPQSEGAKYLAACDILVNATTPSPDGSEFFGSPTKVFEYMAMGKAVICSDMAQMSKILTHERTAYMVKPGDIEDLKMAMKVLVENRAMQKVLGKNARDEVVAKYTWDKHVLRILEHLNALG